MTDKEINTYNGLDIFQPLRKAQGDAKTKMDDELRGIMTAYIRRDIQKTIRKDILLQPEYIENRIQFILSQIQSKVGQGYDRAYFFSSEDGMYRFFDTNGSEIYRANLLTLWNQSNLPPEKLRDIHRKAQEEELALKDILNKESLLGGSVVVQYTVTGVTGGLVGVSALAGIRNGLNVPHKVQSLWIKSPTGTLERVPLGDMVFEGTRDWIKANTLRILERVGVYYNPATRTCINIGAMAITQMMRGLEKLTFSEFRKKHGASVPEAEFQRFKTQLPEFVTLMKKTGNSVAEMAKWVTGKGLNFVMFPMFFSEFQRQPNSATLAAGMMEAVVFERFSEAGGRLGKYLGPVGRGLGPIAGGLAGMWLTKKVEGKLNIDIEKWKMFNGRDMFSSKSSVILHAATGWGVNEVFDTMNDGGVLDTPEQNKNMQLLLAPLNHVFPAMGLLQKASGVSPNFDVGAKIIDWGTMLPESWAKKGPIGWLTGGTGVTPEIDLYKRKASFAMNPWEWFNASIKGRTVDKWNIMVDVYQKNLLEDITRLLGKWQGSQYPFDKGTPDEKKKILEERLNLLLMPVGTSMFQQQANSVVLLVLSEASRWNKDTSVGFLREGIGNYISYMRIDDTFIRLNQLKIDTESQSLQEEFSIFASQLSDPKQKDYILGIYTRTVSGKPIFDPDKIVGGDNPFSDKAHIELSAEHKVFNSLLDAQSLVTRDTVNSNGENVPEKLEIRKLFAILLERLALHSQLIGFQKRIKTVNKNETAGEFVEIEALKKLTK